MDRLRRRARALKRDVVALWLAARDPRVPWHAKAVCAALKQRGARGTFVVDSERVVRWKIENGMPDARNLEDYRVALSGIA